MSKKIFTTSLVPLLLLLATSTARAENNVAATGKIGTLAAGLDFTFKIHDKFNTRINVNGGKLNADGVTDGVTYKGNLRAQTVGGLIDFHPTGGGFRISAGLYNNANKIDLVSSGSANKNVKIGDRFYDITNAKLNADVTFKSIAPYLGVGWGNSVKKGSKWNISFDAGILMQGAPEATLKGTGQAKDIATGLDINLATDEAFQHEIAKEGMSLYKDLSSFKTYPVVSIGVSYNF